MKIRAGFGKLASQDGVALILVLWVFIFLFVIAFEFSTAAREEGTAAQRFSEDTTGYYLALAGFESGLYEFLNQQSSTGSQTQQNTKEDLFDGEFREQKLGPGMPIKDGKGLARPLGQNREDSYALQVIPVRFFSVAEMKRVLTPFLQPGGEIIENPRGNFLIVMDLPSNIQRLTEIADLIDVQVFAGTRMVTHRTVVVIISDGWDRGDVSVLEREMQDLKRRCKKIIWLNPLLASENYEPLCKGMLCVGAANLAALRRTPVRRMPSHYERLP